MLERLKEIILDRQESVLEPGTPRRLEYASMPRKASVFIGVRRCGKSTFMAQQMERLLAEGAPRQSFLYLNFFDDRLHELRQGKLERIMEAWFALYPEKKGREKTYCFFDELQMLPGWESFVERLMREENCEVFITGSSAQMLSREIATQMRGRALTWELFPFSFREYLDFHGVDGDAPLSTRRRLLIQRAFDDYWERGGFPEVAGVERSLRIKLHQEYFNALLFRDLIERHDVAHPKAVTDLAYWLIDNTASLYTINRLTGYLKSLGHTAPKATVSSYLDWFEDAYFFFTVRLFDASLARSHANPKKIYCVDHALITSTSSGVLVNSGHLLENLVFMALRRVTSEIYYLRTRNGREVDFIARLPDRSRLLVQVCESLVEPATRKREVTALAEAMQEQGLSRGVIVTRREEEQIDLANGTIEVLPAWRFLLRQAAGKGRRLAASP